MDRFFRKAWDKSYLLIIPTVLLTYFVPVRIRVGNTMVIPFVVAWLFVVMVKGERARASITRAFLRAFIPLAVFYSLRAFLFGHNAWDYVPFSRHISYAGLLLFFMYLFHYSACRAKVRELVVLCGVVLCCLSYGTFVSLRYDVGTSRGTVMNANDFEAAAERIRLAAEGLTNFDATYAMVYIVIGLTLYLVFVNKKWKLMYFILIGLFVLGVIRAGFSTGTAIMLYGVLLALGANVFRLGMKAKCIGWVFFAGAVIFVLCVACPSILSPFAKLAHSCAYSLQDTAPDYALRLDSIADSMCGYKDTYAVSRAELYWNSIDVFLHNPLVGFRFNQIFLHDKMKLFARGHSYLFDTCACGGLVLLCWFIIGVVNFNRYLKQLYAYAGLPTGMSRIWICTFWMFMICCSINQQEAFCTQIALFFVVPAIPFFNFKYHIRKQYEKFRSVAIPV